MLACFLIKPGTLQIKEVPTPRPTKGKILIKVKVSLTCGTDVKAYLRGHSLIPMPGIFGHEFSGTIAEVGKGVRGFREGDEIMAVHTAPCLMCGYCRKKLYTLCENIMNTKVLGAFAEYLLLPAHIIRQNVFLKKKNLPFEEAAFLEPLSCAVHSLESLDIKKGERVLIIGAGAMGLLHLILLKRKKAKVAVTDIRKERLNVAKRLGSDLTCRPNEIDTVIKSFTKKVGFDYVFECTGKSEVWETSVNYLTRGGTLIFFGGCEKGTKVMYDTYRLHYDEITLQGSFHYTPREVKKAHKLLCEEKLGLSRLISGSYPLRQIQKAFDKLAKGEGIKYAIIP